MEMQMSKVHECEAIDCAYNAERTCHTMAITVGDGSCAMCDTFKKSDMKGGISRAIAGVGACRKEDCQFNESLECSAESITVGMHSGHPDCKTFQMR